MRRREFMLLAGCAAAGWPLAARAQQPEKAYRLAIVNRPGQGTDLAETAGLRYWRAWRAELQRLGYIEGINLIVERREAEGDAQRIDELARHIARLKPDAIFVPAQNMAHALKAAVTTIPIVTLAVDPVESGLVDSLARPGGNITGFSLSASAQLAAKRYELLKEVVPTMSRIAVLILREYWEGRFGNVHREAAQQMGITVIGAPFDSSADEREFRRIFAAIVRDRADSLYLTAQAELLVHRRLIAELAAEARLPAISVYREHAEAGGLMAYAVNLDDIFRRAAGYIDRILNGAKPAEMPFQQPNEFELVLNRKTARALRLTIPESLLARADEVIE
jgi:putative ABC transport system substrate-binding protein